MRKKKKRNEVYSTIWTNGVFILMNYVIRFSKGNGIL